MRRKAHTVAFSAPKDLIFGLSIPLLLYSEPSLLVGAIDNTISCTSLKSRVYAKPENRLSFDLAPTYINMISSSTIMFLSEI